MVKRASISPGDVRCGMPGPVGVGLWHAADGLPPPLLVAEADLIGPRAAERRRVSLAAGRAAARAALRDLGVPPGAIGRGPGGQPLWPPGIVGTITHTEHLAMAMVGWQRDYAGLGVDVEMLDPGVSERAARLVCTPAELAWLACGPAEWRTMVFSAKEAIFKALYPLEDIWLGFSDAELVWSQRGEVFQARLLKQAATQFPIGSLLAVRSRVFEGDVLSVTFAPALG